MESFEIDRRESEKINWIKNLVRGEQQMEETGMIDMSLGFDPDKILVQETLQFLLGLKSEFIDACNSFNELKTSPLGRIKVYGIAKTHADFMLFRNGFKMIFSFKNPGVVSIRFNFVGSNFIPSPQNAETQNESNLMDEHLIEAQWAPFGEVKWTYQGHIFKRSYLIQYYLTLFIKESAK